MDVDSKSSGLTVKVILGLVGVGVFFATGGLKQQFSDGADSSPARVLTDAEGTSAVTTDDSEDFALFTHEKNELHCMERELRHPCVRELRNWIADRDDKDLDSIAYNCVNEVLETSTDFYELKNMTHLMLDLDTNVHVFDKVNRHNKFVLTGIKFAERLMRHEECLADFDLKGPYETRCVPLYAKLAILKYKNAGMQDKAKELFDKVTGMSWNGKVRTYAAGEAVLWDHWRHTPQIWMENLRSQPVWPREQWPDLPITTFLEENFATIKEEAMQANIAPEENGFTEAYRFLYEKGSWDTVMLYHNREWADECETVFKKTCALLKQQLPSKPGMPWTSNQNEQAMVIKMAPGTDVEMHSGPANNILNIHIGISGLEGARLWVADTNYTWQEGKVIAWDGSYDHTVDCVHCPKERVIMMVRYMHPDTSAAHFKGMKRTHYEEIPAEMQ
jgi:hypothetical protein